MPQDPFASILSISNPTPGPGNMPSLSPPKIEMEKGGWGEAISALGGLVAGAGKIAEDWQKEEIVTGADKAIENTFDKVTGAIPGIGDITDVADKVAAYKTAREQGTISGDAFHLQLAKEIKALKVQYPHQTSYIDKVFREKGLTDPSVAMIQNSNQLAFAREQRADMAFDAIVNKAVEGGLIEWNKKGDPTSGIDRNATYSRAVNYAASVQSENLIMKQLGYERNKDGEMKSIVRPAFAKVFPTLKEADHVQITEGIVPLVRQVQQRLLDPTVKPAEIQGMLQTAYGQLNDLYAQKASVADVKLSPAEAKLYKESLKETIGYYTNIISGAKDITDLNSLKAISDTLDAWTKGSKNRLATNAPFLASMSQLDRVGQVIVEQTLINRPGEMVSAISKSAESLAGDLNTFADFFPPKDHKRGEKISDNPVALKNSEVEYGKREKAVRVPSTYEMNYNINKAGTVLTSPADLNAWLMMQGPSMDAVANGKYGEKEFEKIKDIVIDPTFQANLTNAAKAQPKMAEQVGAYAHGVIQKNILDKVRQIEGTMGEDFSLVYNPETKGFAIKSPEFVYTGPEYARKFENIRRSGLEAREQGVNNRPDVKARLAEINKTLPVLLNTKQYVEKYKGMSDDDFLKLQVQTVNTVTSQVPANEKNIVEQPSIEELIPNPTIAPTPKQSEFEGELPNMIGINNPGNIRVGKTMWQGMSETQRHPEFVTFDTPEMGLRAMARLLGTYSTKYDLNTVKGVISRWAPPTENKTKNYINFVSKEMGVKPTDVLDLEDITVLSSLMKAMIKMENGSVPYSDDLILKGIRMAGL